MESEGAQLTIALDYDDTYTADPGLWNLFIKSARERGHKVICVTCRNSRWADDDCLSPLKALPVLVYYTDMAPKRWHMEQLGITVDIWIDDCPECVKEGR
jgi:hypothetical protein